MHSIEYYRRVFTLARERPGFGVRVRLFLADIEGRTEAGIMTAQTGKTSVYLYGASSNSRREYMPSYALQWQALRAAKETGALQYDMFGIPPVRDPDHPMAGLRRFKTGFGGTILNRPGSWDYPLIPSLYTLYLGAEKARTWYYRRFKKRGITQQG
ncbi:MAG: peptidoglycan bridge formation glycyltransferase FemA/FemB family protein [Spirochaetales bacterium]|nr:MAG: peptidoglycan bridge formation glycyltransferase FemA/FemB family protein [Spirochaetales bacterium]